MDASAWISLLAIVISVIGGVFNYYHSKKLFNADRYPLLKIQLNTGSTRTRYHSATIIGFNVTNLHNDMTAIDVKVKLSIGEAAKFKWLKRKGNLTLFEARYKSISPTLSIGEAIFDGVNPLEDKILELMPDSVTENNRSPSEGAYLQLNGANSFMLCLSVEYLPNFYGSSTLIKSEYRILKPQFKEGTRLVEEWQFQEVGRKK